MSNQISLCEYCPQQIPCRNLYVALKILEEELRCAQRPDLNQTFQRLKDDMRNAGYNYPTAGNPCSLTDSDPKVQGFLSRSEALLQELRLIVKRVD